MAGFVFCVCPPCHFETVDIGSTCHVDPQQFLKLRYGRTHKKIQVLDVVPVSDAVLMGDLARHLLSTVVVSPKAHTFNMMTFAGEFDHARWQTVRGMLNSCNSISRMVVPRCPRLQFIPQGRSEAKSV